MYVATMLASPEQANLDRIGVESLRDAWGGGAAVWLNPGIAAEFDVSEIPANRWEVWGGLQALGIDLVLQPSEGRRKKMLLADMDSTMIGQECIDELADMAGVGPRVAEITARAMNGELDFEGALSERVGLLRGLPEAVIGQVLAERITYTPGGRELVSTMKAHGGYAALVSGGFTAFTQAVAAHLGFDENRANTLLTSCGKLTGEVAPPDPRTGSQDCRAEGNLCPSRYRPRCRYGGRRRGERPRHARSGGRWCRTSCQACRGRRMRHPDQPRRSDGAPLHPRLRNRRFCLTRA